MTTLFYRSNVHVDELELGECTMHRAGEDGKGTWWLLWFRVLREDNGQPANFAVPMNPGGSWIENGPGGKTWGFARSSPGIWQVSPSINALASSELHPGEHPDQASQWHQTPMVIGVPDGERWIANPDASKVT